MVDQLFRQLNALVRTQDQRDRIKEALRTNHGQQALEVRHAGFHLIRDQVYYSLPSGEEVKLIMCENEKKEQLTKEFNKPENASKGIGNVYFAMKQKYLNITREDVSQFLKWNEKHVMAQKSKPRVNKSITSAVKEKDSAWALDLIEMSD